MQPVIMKKGENALALYGHSKYQDYKAALGDDLILVPLPDMGHGVYTCSGSTVMIMTTGAQESGKDDAVWAMLQEATNPDYIKMVVDVNGAVPARSSVMDAIPDYCEGGTLYLYRQQLESGISFLRPYTPAHMTIYDAMASVIGNIYAGADPATELHDAAANIDEIITIKDDELIDAFLDMVENHKLVAENSGLLSIAALKHLKCKDKKIVSIISGGNMDIITMSSTLQHGLIQRGRVFTVSVLLPDKPGELVKVANTIAEQQGNVIKLDHNQFVSSNRNAAVELKITLEAFGSEHKQRIIKALQENGYTPKNISVNI